MVAYEYVENDDPAKDPVELVCLLYLKAIEKLNQARAYPEAGRVEERGRAVAHAMSIVIELQGTLDFEQGGEVATDLARLYDYIQRRLVEAISSRDAAPLEQAAAVLSILHQGWKESNEQLRAERVPAAVPAEAEPPASGRSWVL